MLWEAAQKDADSKTEPASFAFVSYAGITRIRFQGFRARLLCLSRENPAPLLFLYSRIVTLRSGLVKWQRRKRGFSVKNSGMNVAFFEVQNHIGVYSVKVVEVKVVEAGDLGAVFSAGDP